LSGVALPGKPATSGVHGAAFRVASESVNRLLIIGVPLQVANFTGKINGFNNVF
jgi:hypothetical protein